jgi:bacterioferritin-associated ferredoxin
VARNVSRCVCFDVSFEELKKIAEETKSFTVLELEDHADFGMGCGMCRTYVSFMLLTGKTSFDPSKASGSPYKPDKEEEESKDE